MPVGFEGGQTPLKKRIPKFGGFTRQKRRRVQIVNLREIGENFQANQIVSPKSLAEKGLIKNIDYPVKILGNGDLKKKIKFKDCLFSKNVEKKLRPKKTKK